MMPKLQNNMNTETRSFHVFYSCHRRQEPETWGSGIWNLIQITGMILQNRKSMSNVTVPVHVVISTSDETPRTNETRQNGKEEKMRRPVSTVKKQEAKPIEGGG
jgi:hypothetical protein